GGRHEVDMIVEGTDGFLAIEVKLSATVDDRDTTHLRWLRQQLPEHCVDLVVLTTGPQAYRRRDGTAVVPLCMLVP
ncbi:MAG: AAA family ATPase, partial [Actinomycetota bacterium]|nr:AAA family ATPase [Actinomycetota bacterium]